LGGGGGGGGSVSEVQIAIEDSRWRNAIVEHVCEQRTSRVFATGSGDEDLKRVEGLARDKEA
jgi:hypothetical protein